MKDQFAGMHGEIWDSEKFGILGKGISVYLRSYLITFYYHTSVLESPGVYLPALIIIISEDKLKLLCTEAISGPELSC